MIKVVDNKPKVVFEEKVNCPYCNKRIIIKKTKKLLEPSQKAEYDEKIVVTKDSQTELPAAEDPKKKKKK